MLALGANHLLSGAFCSFKDFRFEACHGPGLLTGHLASAALLPWFFAHVVVSPILAFVVVVEETWTRLRP